MFAALGTAAADVRLVLPTGTLEQLDGAARAGLRTGMISGRVGAAGGYASGRGDVHCGGRRKLRCRDAGVSPTYANRCMQRRRTARIHRPEWTSAFSAVASHRLRSRPSDRWGRRACRRTAGAFNPAGPMDRVCRVRRGAVVEAAPLIRAPKRDAAVPLVAASFVVRTGEISAAATA